MALRSVRACQGVAVAVAATVVVVAATTVSAGPQADATPQERLAALKRSLQDGQAALHRYEWIETTAISLKGEEKSRKQQRCYYGADGKLQKLQIGEAAPAPAAPSGGRRGSRLRQRIVENKKDEIQDYMERAAGLVHQYVPPSPEAVQRAKDAGKVTLGAPATGRVRLELADFLKPGDRLAVDVDTAANRLVALQVASYLDDAEDAVTLNVTFGTLSDGTTYPAETTLQAAAKNVRVVIQNGGHRPLGQ